MVSDQGLKRQRGIKLGMIAGVFQFGSVAAVQFLLIRIILNHLGKDGYGAWSLLTLVVYWSALFDFGLSKGLLNSLADANGQKDHERAVTATSSALAVLAMVGIVGSLFVWAGTCIWGTELLHYFKLDSAGANIWILGCVGTAFFINMPLSVFSQIFWAYQLRHIAVIFLVSSSLATLLLELLGVRLGLGLNWMVFLFILPMILGSALSGAYLFLVSMPWLHPRLKFVRFSALKEMSGTSIGYFCFGVLGFLINETQPSIIARIGTLAVTAEWQIIARIILSLAAPIQMSTFAFVPALREAVASGDKPWMRKTFRNLIIIRMLGASAGTAILYFFGPYALTLIGKNMVLHFSTTSWLLIILTVLVFTWNSCYTDLFLIMDKVWYTVAGAGLNAVAILWLTVYWVPKIGIRGAQQAYVALPLVLFTWAVPILARYVIFGEHQHEN